MIKTFLTTTTLLLLSLYPQAPQTANADAFTGSKAERIIAAIASLTDGGTVYVGVGGTISANTFAGLTGSKSITLVFNCGTTYLVNVEQSYRTAMVRAKGLTIRGCGVDSTIIDNRVANGFAFSFDGSNAGASDNTPQLNSAISNLTITNTTVPPATDPATSPANSSGIALRSQRYPTIENVKIEALSGDAIQIVNNSGDADATALLTLNNLSITNNGGRCLNMLDGQNASGGSTINHLLCSHNHAGGVRLLGLDWKMATSSISYNIGVGLSVPFVSGNTLESLDVSNCEFDGNHVANIDLQAAIRARFTNNKHITSNQDGAFLPTTPIIIGTESSGAVIAAIFENDQFRRDGGTQTSYTINATAQHPLINSPVWTSSAGVTKYDDPFRRGIYFEDGKEIHAAVKPFSITTSGSYAPDLLNGVYQRIVIPTAGLFVLDAPIGASDGRALELDLVNASSGVITIAFDAAYAHPAGFVAPASGTGKTAMFRYNPNSGTWRIIGSWSAEF